MSVSFSELLLIAVDNVIAVVEVWLLGREVLNLDVKAVIHVCNVIDAQWPLLNVA